MNITSRINSKMPIWAAELDTDDIKLTFILDKSSDDHVSTDIIVREIANSIGDIAIIRGARQDGNNVYIDIYKNDIDIYKNTEFVFDILATFQNIDRINGMVYKIIRKTT